MSFNANQKFSNAILTKLSEYSIISEKDITDEDELKNIMKSIPSKGFYDTDFSWFLKCYRLIDIKAKEYSYETGLKLFINKSTIEKDGDFILLEQHTVLSDYNSVPLVNLIVSKSEKALQQLLTSSEYDSTVRDKYFKKCPKDIAINNTTIYVNNKCGSTFQVCTRLSNNSLIVENYKQAYPLTKCERSNKDLLNLCGCCNRKLEVFYNDEEPILAQLSDKYNVEMAGFTPDCPSDIKKIISIVSGEINEIINNIYASIDKYNKKSSFAKKRTISPKS